MQLPHNMNNTTLQEGSYSNNYASQQAPPRPPHHHPSTYQHQNPVGTMHGAMHSAQPHLNQPQRPLSQNMGPLHIQAPTNLNKVKG